MCLNLSETRTACDLRRVAWDFILDPDECEEQLSRLPNSVFMEEMEDIRAFFSAFGVSLQNDDGTYKNLLDIFQEAADRIDKLA